MAKGKSPHPSSYYSRISWWRKKAINVEGKCNLNLSCKEKLSKIKVSKEIFKTVFLVINTAGVVQSSRMNEEKVWSKSIFI